MTPWPAGQRQRPHRYLPMQPLLQWRTPRLPPLAGRRRRPNPERRPLPQRPPQCPQPLPRWPRRCRRGHPHLVAFLHQFPMQPAPSQALFGCDPPSPLLQQLVQPRLDPLQHRSAHIIPAIVIVDRDGDEPPKLVLDEGGSDLGELIAKRGIEIEEESGEMISLRSGRTTTALNRRSPWIQINPSLNRSMDSRNA